MQKNAGSFGLICIPEREMSPVQDQAIRDLLCACFQPDVPVFSRTRYWHGTSPEFSFVYQKDQKVLGHVGIVVRPIRVGSAQIKIAGIQSLAVDSEMRGTGLSEQLMTDSMRKAHSQGIEFGILFCVEKLERFYASLGWKKISIQVSMTGPDGKDAPLPEKNICMVLEMGKNPFPPGDIHLLGADW
jgi:predicted acetyltransferase